MVVTLVCFCGRPEIVPLSRREVWFSSIHFHLPRWKRQIVDHFAGQSMGEEWRFPIFSRQQRESRITWVVFHCRVSHCFIWITFCLIFFEENENILGQNATACFTFEMRPLFHLYYFEIIQKKKGKKIEIAGLLYPVSNFKCSPAVSALVHVVISC